jgi:hypothetical protein
MPLGEVNVIASTPMPKGYGFLRKGIRYKTLHCRKLTHEAGRTLYVVLDAKKVQTGIRVPKFILQQVHKQANETLSSRRAATERRDASLLATASSELHEKFPEMPEDQVKMVLKHGFKKNSGRVGRTSLIPLSRKAVLAVIAHVRHKHTEYNKMLERGDERKDARRAVRKQIEIILRRWGFTEGKATRRSPQLIS